MPIDKESGMVEPDIIINGEPLNFAESMSVRVAITTFRLWLDSRSTRQNLGGLADNYDHHLENVERLMRR